MKKKILSLLLAVTLLLGVSSIQVFAAETPTITVNASSGAAGSRVTATLDISNNPGFSSARIKVAYDSSLTLVSVQRGNLLPGALFQESPPGANPATFIWVGLANSTANGTLLTLTFDIDETADPGDLPISVSYDAGDILATGNPDTAVTFAVENGGVAVTGNTDAVFSGSNVTAKLGEEFVYTVSLSNNPGFVAFLATLTFDQTKLEYLPYNDESPEDALGSAFDDANNFFIINELIAADEGKVIVASASAFNATSDGDLFHFRFKIIDDSITTAQIDIEINEFIGFGHIIHDFSVDSGVVTLDRETDPVLIGKLGDMDGDGNISAFDAVIILQISSGIISATPQQLILGNVLGSGGPSTFDAVLVLQHSGGQVTSYPIGENIYEE